MGRSRAKIVLSIPGDQSIEITERADRESPELRNAVKKLMKYLNRIYFLPQDKLRKTQQVQDRGTKP